jgi:hypothetical protein
MLNFENGIGYYLSRNIISDFPVCYDKIEVDQLTISEKTVWPVIRISCYRRYCAASSSIITDAALRTPHGSCHVCIGWKFTQLLLRFLQAH